jgi:tetratricopeptide (TPR) repeat protein
MVLSEQGRLRDAEGYFGKALKIFPAYALAHYQLGRVHLRNGGNQEARRELEVAVSLQQQFPEAWYQLGQVYRKLGMKSEAVVALERFKQYRTADYSEREQLLRQLRETVQSGF